MIGGLLKSAKFWVILAAITATMAFLKWAHDAVYDAGYNAADLAWKEAQRNAQEKELEASDENDQIVTDAAEENIEDELEIIERVRIVEREVPKYIVEYVEPDCRDLGPDIQRLFNDAIRAGNNLPRAPAEDRPQPPAEVSGTDTG